VHAVTWQQDSMGPTKTERDLNIGIMPVWMGSIASNGINQNWQLTNLLIFTIQSLENNQRQNYQQQSFQAINSTNTDNYQEAKVI